MTTRKRLCAIKGISEAKVDKIKVGYSSFTPYITECCAQGLGIKSGYKVSLSINLFFTFAVTSSSVQEAASKLNVSINVDASRFFVC